MANTTDPRVKEYVDYAARQVDEQAILDKYNAATLAQFAAQREQNRIAENKFYNQMYNTQKTAMDTIRQSNAAAVSSGASRGVQAANELSALLGLEQESVASATELAQANRQTAQEETAAVLENVLNAYQQASQERSQLVTQAIEAASLDATEAQAATEAAGLEETKNMNAQTVAKEGATELAALLAGQDRDLSEYSEQNKQYLDLNLDAIATANDEDFATKWARKFSGGTHKGAKDKLTKLKSEIQTICDLYGLDATDTDLQDTLKRLDSVTTSHGGLFAANSDTGFLGIGGTDRATLRNWYNEELANIKDNLKAQYAKKANKK